MKRFIIVTATLFLGNVPFAKSQSATKPLPSTSPQFTLTSSQVKPVNSVHKVNGQKKKPVHVQKTTPSKDQKH